MSETHEYAWIDELASLAPRINPSIGKVPKPLAKAFVSAFGVRDPEGEVITKDGTPIADDELTDFENVPLGVDVHDYLAQEVLPHAADAFIDDDYRDEYDGQLGVVGYEINFNRYFYEYKPPRELHEIDAELKQVEAEISQILNEVTE
jgi:type I restriction enzyme M protein